MRITDRVTMLAAVLAFSLITIGAADAAEITRFSANGSSASTNSFDGTTFIDLTVTRNEAGQGTTTNLFFSRQSCDVNGCSGVFGFGTIPNADFTAATGTSKLNTNLAGAPGYQCFSFNSGGQTPMSCGVIAIDWKSIPRQSSSNTGQSSFVSGAFSNKFSGSQSSNQARANGSIFAAPIPTDSSGFIGQNKTSQLIINRN